MWISRKDWNERLQIHMDALKLLQEWQATHAAQLRALAEGQDRLMQSHAALDKAQDVHHLGFHKRLLGIETKISEMMASQAVCLGDALTEWPRKSKPRPRAKGQKKRKVRD